MLEQLFLCPKHNNFKVKSYFVWVNLLPHYTYMEKLDHYCF